MEKERFFAINRDAGLYFINCLWNRKNDGMEYLRNRRGLDNRVLRMFGLGYAPKTGLKRYLRKRGYRDIEGFEAGLLNRNSEGEYYDRFRNRVMFPIIDRNSRVTGFGGRVLDDSLPKYLNSPDSDYFKKSDHLYGENIAQKSIMGQLILCEGYLDVISMHQYGFDCAVASLGTAFTSGHVEEIKKLTSRVIVSYDSDKPGREACFKAVQMLRKEGIKSRVLDTLPCKDPDEFAKKYGQKGLLDRICSSKDDVSFMLDHMRTYYNLGSIDERILYQVRCIQMVCNYLDPALREPYFRRIMDEFNITEGAIIEIEDIISGKKRVPRNAQSVWMFKTKY